MHAAAARRREADAGDELVGPVRPSAAGDGSDSDAEACEDEREGGGGGAAQDPYNLPVTHEVVLTGKRSVSVGMLRFLLTRAYARAGHTRLVSALDVEHTGSRVVTGGCVAEQACGLTCRALQLKRCIVCAGTTSGCGCTTLRA
jgi:hypothetical protein